MIDVKVKRTEIYRRRGEELFLNLTNLRSLSLFILRHYPPLQGKSNLFLKIIN